MLSFSLFRSTIWSMLDHSRRVLPHMGIATMLAAGLAGAVHAAPLDRGGDTTRGNPAQSFELARKQGEPALRAWLAAMPKGADLHNHLSGAVYAESWIAQAAHDGLCVDPKALRLLRTHAPDCGPDALPAAKALADQHLYDALIDAFSMRDFVASSGHSGHDQFFDSFARFDAIGESHLGDALAEVSARAGAQNEQYLELMITPSFRPTAELAAQVGWNTDLAALREELLRRGLKNSMAQIHDQLDQAQALRAQQQQCGRPQASAGCHVEVRFLYQVLRGAAPEQVFAQTLLGFELASSDPRWVGINFVMPEDGYLSMRDYDLQMRMLDFLHQRYPKVHITLHAGELAPGMVPPDGLRSHIREAIELGHAERIGHGVDVMYEDRPRQLLAEMARRQVLVEINLTSNAVILGVEGKRHPLPLYLAQGVPVALSTDDEGVSRIDLTHEYVKAAEDFNLSYADLKRMARNSLSYSFLPGANLWADPANPGNPVPACAGQPLGAEKPEAACRSLLSGSEKARQQWELERRYQRFEQTTAND